jgi:prepilin-type N-terminal cleavage/methylation domain-containing protein
MNKLIKQAFTLIELLVVIAIIGILSGLIIVSMSGVNNKATIAKSQVFSNSLRNSLMLNLVSEWKFDELTTVVTTTGIQDSWGGANNGTYYPIAGDTTEKLSSDCVSGKCLYFDGVDDYIDLGSSSSLKNNKITYDLWINPYSWLCPLTGSASHFIYWNSDGIGITLSTNSISGWVHAGGARRTVSATIDSLQEWYNVVLTYDGFVVKLYINGIQQNSFPYVSTTITYGGNLYIGRTGSLNFTYKGYIDNIRIYNSEISSSQIKEHYYSGLNTLLSNGAINSSEYYSKIQEFSSIDF